MSEYRCQKCRQAVLEPTMGTAALCTVCGGSHTRILEPVSEPPASGEVEERLRSMNRNPVWSRDDWAFLLTAADELSRLQSENALLRKEVEGLRLAEDALAEVLEQSAFERRNGDWRVFVGGYYLGAADSAFYRWYAQPEPGIDELEVCAVPLCPPRCANEEGCYRLRHGECILAKLAAAKEDAEAVADGS